MNERDARASEGFLQKKGYDIKSFGSSQIKPSSGISAHETWTFITTEDGID